ncbi:unnamed protein product [Rotaria socialis]|uniref:Peptidase S33 tripeptidyl aminopeptidase-like C-terminal domain-containing protein n=1 Tax=Rotaria socialis TaxID=392032 RepID=A0A819WRJ7_9BILA|nr:unnamed protein product [Rotaria socialis]CAF4818382.1 unnamed protein product [Rotaria socialis]
MELLVPNFYCKFFCRLQPWPEVVDRALSHLNTDIYNLLQGPSEFSITGTLASWDRKEDLVKIKVPTLIIGATYDTMNPEYLQWMASQLENSSSVICPNGSHCAMWDDQLYYFSKLIEFIKNVANQKEDAENLDNNLFTRSCGCNNESILRGPDNVSFGNWKKAQTQTASVDQPEMVVLLLLAIILVGVVIAIPIIYTTGRNPADSIDQSITNVSTDYTKNECTQTFSNVETIAYLTYQEPFPFKLHTYIYRPTVITTRLSVMFAFRHDTSSWSLDKISFNDTTNDQALFTDGDFESNYLNKNYEQCILSNTRSSITDILFDNPYSNDFYYNDQTNVGMTYLSQQIDVIGGRYYNISFYLENRGYPNNTFLLLIGY